MKFSHIALCSLLCDPHFVRFCHGLGLPGYTSQDNILLPTFVQLLLIPTEGPAQPPPVVCSLSLQVTGLSLSWNPVTSPVSSYLPYSFGTQAVSWPEGYLNSVEGISCAPQHSLSWHAEDIWLRRWDLSLFLLRQLHGPLWMCGQETWWGDIDWELEWDRTREPVLENRSVNLGWEKGKAYLVWILLSSCTLYLKHFCMFLIHLPYHLKWLHGILQSSTIVILKNSLVDGLFGCERFLWWYDFEFGIERYVNLTGRPSLPDWKAYPSHLPHFWW